MSTFVLHQRFEFSVLTAFSKIQKQEGKKHKRFNDDEHDDIYLFISRSRQSG